MNNKKEIEWFEEALVDRSKQTSRNGSVVINQDSSDQVQPDSSRHAFQDKMTSFLQRMDTAKAKR